MSLSVEAGEVYGLLGPNGAGKTTMARMLSTLLEPTSGSARICGHDTVRDGTEVRTRIGVMFAGERGVFWRLTGRENLQMFGRLVFMDGNAIRRRTDELMERLGLADRTDELVESYSTGMKQRLNLARTLMHDPPVLLLDEPTAALDPAAARATRRFVDELRGEGKAILLTTHNMHEADEVCDRVGIIDKGRLIAEDRPADLIRRAGVEPRLELMLRGNTSPRPARDRRGRPLVGGGRERWRRSGRGASARRLAIGRGHYATCDGGGRGDRPVAPARSHPGRRLHRADRQPS